MIGECVINVMTYFQGEVFINGARFIEANIDSASNGILHIIDHIFLEDTLTSNAYSYITHATSVAR